MLTLWHTLPAPARYALLAGAVALLLVPWYLLLHRPVLPPTPSQRILRPDGVTQNDFRALHYGRKADGIPCTTYAQAVALMGEGTLLDTSADGCTRTYQWSGGGRWGRLEATFRDGQLKGKLQILLQRN